MTTTLRLAEPTSRDYDVYYHPFPDMLVLTPRTRPQNINRQGSMRSIWHHQYPRGGDDQFWITGRGPSFQFKHNPALDLWDPSLLVGEWILINYGLFLVLGVECFRPCISPEHPYGDRSIGILVRDHTKLPSDYYESRSS